MKERSAVILCGGRGRRLGDLGERLPKTLVEVHGRPVLWYIILHLYGEGFRHFILPLGYRGELIQGFIDRYFTDFDVRIDAIPTGENSEVGLRLHRVWHLLPDDNFLLVNGDTIFDFPVNEMCEAHEASGMAITLASCEVVSQFGLLVLDGDRVVDFTRDSLVQKFQVIDRRDGVLREATVNAGIALLKTDALNRIDLPNSQNFEADLYAHLILQSLARHHIIQGFWFAIDTLKDLELANSRRADDSRAAGSLALHAKLIAVEQSILGHRGPVR